VWAEESNEHRGLPAPEEGDGWVLPSGCFPLPLEYLRGGWVSF